MGFIKGIFKLYKHNLIGFTKGLMLLLLVSLALPFILTIGLFWVTEVTNYLVLTLISSDEKLSSIEYFLNLFIGSMVMVIYIALLVALIKVRALSLTILHFLKLTKEWVYMVSNEGDKLEEK